MRKSKLQSMLEKIYYPTMRPFRVYRCKYKGESVSSNAIILEFEKWPTMPGHEDTKLALSIVDDLVNVDWREAVLSDKGTIPPNPGEEKPIAVVQYRNKAAGAKYAKDFWVTKRIATYAEKKYPQAMTLIGYYGEQRVISWATYDRDTLDYIIKVIAGVLRPKTKITRV